MDTKYREKVFYNGEKAFAIYVLSEAWAGRKWKSPVLKLAKCIRAKMLKEGTWASA